MKNIPNKTILLLVIVTVVLSLFSTVMLLGLNVSGYDEPQTQEDSRSVVNKGPSGGRIGFSIIEDSDYAEDSNLQNKNI